MKRKVLYLALVSVFLLYSAVNAIADCHDDDEWECENLERHLW